MNEEETPKDNEFDANNLTGLILDYYDRYRVPIESAVKWQSRISELKPVVKEVQKQFMIAQAAGFPDHNTYNAIMNLIKKLQMK